MWHAARALKSSSTRHPGLHGVRPRRRESGAITGIGGGAEEPRHRGWRDACATHGVLASPGLYAPFTREGGYRAGLELAAADDRPGAIFASSDLCTSMRGQVPEDIAIVYFDGSRETEYSWPALSSVRQPIEAMAEASVDRLLDQHSAERILRPACGLSPTRMTGTDSRWAAPPGRRRSPFRAKRRSWSSPLRYDDHARMDRHDPGPVHEPLETALTSADDPRVYSITASSAGTPTDRTDLDGQGSFLDPAPAKDPIHAVQAACAGLVGVCSGQ
ncbi:substrate-binding domain-containing protein [Nonomuraea sp. NPDC005650]|uniref:substrate-binding domain-containing protein n=1 Tax=Nonomuraea sp. NPDC005650 TaxID=3157045 RepID=UPI0033B96A84